MKTMKEYMRNRSDRIASNLYIILADKNCSRWHQRITPRRTGQHFFVKPRTDWTLPAVFGVVIFLVFVLWTATQIEMWVNRTVANSKVEMEKR